MTRDSQSGIKTATINGNRFFCGDCISGAKQFIRDGSVDLIITDPPYGINGDSLHVHYNRDERYVAAGYVEIPEEEYGEFSRSWIREAERVLRPGGSLYIVSGYTNLYHVLGALRETGLREVNHIVWKYTFGVFTRRKFISAHYHILFYEKPGGRRVFNLESRFGLDERTGDGGSMNYRDREDVWAMPREYKPGILKNKNELPAALLEKIILYSSNEGDLVMDFFLGGFSTAKTAIQMNRRATGFEISGEIFRAKVAELRGIVPGSGLGTLRSPCIRQKANQRIRWSAEEVSRLSTRYHELLLEGKKKGQIVEVLSGEHQRGQWAIRKALKRLGL